MADEVDFWDDLSKVVDEELFGEVNTAHPYGFACMDENGLEGILWFKTSQTRDQWVNKYKDGATYDWEKITWIGKFADLLSSEDESSKSYRFKFRESYLEDEDSHDTPISEKEQDDFIEFLDTQGA